MKKTDVEQWLLSFFSERKDVSGQDRDELLGSNYLENGLIDSMGIIQLVLALEKRFSVNIGNDAFQDRRFVTASGLAELVMELLPANHVGSETYTKSDFIDAIRNCGIVEGDILFSHSNIGFLGVPEGAITADDACSVIYDAIREVIGEHGTLVVPTFTYSFGAEKTEKVFDVTNAASNMGVFAEYIRKKPASYRSSDPMFSVAAIGARAKQLVENVSEECFGKDSFWDRFYKSKGKILNINFDSGSSFIHFVEKQLAVSYRKDREFFGTLIMSDGTHVDAKAVFFCRDLKVTGTETRFERFNALALQTYSKIARVGRGEVLVLTADEIFDLIHSTLPREPDFLTLGGANGR